VNLKTRLSSIVESGWTLTASVAGWLWRSHASAWSSPGGQRVLVIAPHPDDEVMGCAGALIEHRRCGDAISIVFVTDGGQSRALGLDRATMIARRRREAEASAHYFQAESVWLGLPEGEWPSEQAAASLKSTVMDLKPQVIYVPSRVDFHPEHRRVAQAIARALPPDSPIELRAYPILVPLTPTLSNRVLDVSALRTEIKSAMHVYATQIDSIQRMPRLRRYAARLHRRGMWAEEFWQMTPQQYRRLHLEPDEVIAFRGLRGRAWTDGLAYVSGARERRRLLKQTGRYQPDVSTAD